MRETKGSCIMGNDVRNLLLADFLLSDFADLEGGLLSVDSVRLESSLYVIEHSVVLVCLDNGEDVHGTDGILNISSNFIINFESSLLVLGDYFGFATGQGEFEVIP